MTKPVGAIVLAAGFSTRFGSSKLLARLRSEKTVFQQTIERISAALPEMVVVTRPQLVGELQKLVPETAIQSFDNADQGMGASLAFAARQLGDWSGCLICLGDMPFIETSTYRKIAEQLQETSIVVPTQDGRTGNPVAFSSNYFSELSKLDGDSGAKRLIESHPEAVQRLPVDDPGILQDIDTQAELARFQGS